MKMDEHARAWSHEFVSSVLANAGLAPEQRTSLHWEILNHLHEKAERRVESRAGQTITLADIQAIVGEMGGREGVASMFLQTRIVASPRAGFGKRTIAFVIDALVGFLAIGLFFMTLGWVFFFGPWGWGPFPGFIWVGLFYAYLVVMEIKFGQTIGKMAFNLRTVMVDGRPLTTEAAVIRNISKAIPFLLLIDVVIYLIAGKAEDQRPSDKIAKTIVIDTTKSNWSAPAPPMMPTPEPPPTTPPLPPRFEPVGEEPPRN